MNSVSTKCSLTTVKQWLTVSTDADACWYEYESLAHQVCRLICARAKG